MPHFRHFDRRLPFAAARVKNSQWPRPQPVQQRLQILPEDRLPQLAFGGAVFSQDINVALRVARGVRTGRMWVNTYNQLPAGAPFGGYKKSGIGRETHKSMLDAYTQMKNIYIVTKEEADGLY